jgi:hypothetical protein
MARPLVKERARTNEYEGEKEGSGRDERCDKERGCKKKLTNPRPIRPHPARPLTRIPRAARDVVRAPADVVHGAVEDLREQDDIGSERGE